MDPTRTLLSCSNSMASRGTPRPATNTRAPPFTTSPIWLAIWPGSAVRRSTPNGFEVSSRTLAISATISSGRIVDAPMQPKPPASETAATRRWYETPPIPASMTGWSTSRMSVRRVRNMARTL